MVLRLRVQQATHTRAFLIFTHVVFIAHALLMFYSMFFAGATEATLLVAWTYADVC